MRQFIETQEQQGAIDFNNDDIKLSPATQRLLLNDFVKGGELQTQFRTITKAEAASKGIGPQEAEGFLNQAFQIITALEAQGIDILSMYDFNDIFEKDLEELRELFQYANSELALINNTKAVKEIFTAREQELLANDPALLGFVA